MRKRSILVTATIALALAASSPVLANEDEVDYVELAARLIADGHVERAELALQQVDAEDSALDRARFNTIDGLIALRRADHPRAVAAFEAALGAVADDDQAARERIHLYLAQALFGLRDFAAVLDALDRAGETAAAIPMVFALRAQAHWDLGAHGASLDALNEGAVRFPDDARFLRRKVFYLIELGFHQQAALAGQRYLADAEATAEDYLAIGGALRRSDQHPEALKVLERGRLVFPQHRDLAVELAHTWLELDDERVAADVLANAAVRHTGLLVDGAELQRRAGRLHRALLMNSFVTDAEAKFRQRFSILVQMERWDLAAGMGDALTRSGLLADDELRYAYAYAHFRAGNLDASDRALSGITDGAIFERAAELRRAMESCRVEPWQCP